MEYCFTNVREKMTRADELKKIGDFLLGLKMYQNYSVGYNGDPEDKSVADLTNRIDSLLDDEELDHLGLLVEGNKVGKVMVYLSYGITDFNFNQD